MRIGLRESTVESIDQSVRLVQFSPQSGTAGVSAGRPASVSAPIPLVGGVELARHIVDVPVQLAQQCLRLGSPHIIDHVRIFSSTVYARSVILKIVD